MQVQHNPAQSRFELLVGADAAVCDYRREGSVWILPHTYVPESMRGAGVAAALVKASLEHIKAQGGTVVPACSYVAAYIQRHPAYASLVAPV